MRDDDDLVVAAVVGGVHECVDVGERGHVPFKNAGAWQRLARGVSEIGIDVENDAQNYASAAGKAGKVAAPRYPNKTWASWRCLKSH